MKPRSDLVLQIASTSEVAKTQAATYAGHLIGLDRLSATTVRAHAGDPEPRRIGLPAGAIRQHRGAGHRRDAGPTPSATPRDDESSTFLVKLTPGGVMSTYLAERAAVGD